MGHYMVGFGRTDCTPDFTVSLSGFGNLAYRLNKTVSDHIYASCIAISDEWGATMLLYATDNERVPSAYIEPVIRQLSEKFGVPETNIIINATHTHSSPQINPSRGAVGYEEYQALLTRKLFEATELAIADRVQASMCTAKGNIEGLNYVKHYYLDDGSCAGDQHGSFEHAAIVRHTNEPDKEARLMMFKREGKKDILLVNWQGHPHITCGLYATTLSSDYIGGIRDYMEKNTGVLFAFLQGCAGDLNTSSRIPEENPPQETGAFGKLMGDQLISIMSAGMKTEGAGPIKGIKRVIIGTVDHSKDYLREKAVAASRLFGEGKLEEAMAKSKEYGFESIYHAGFIAVKAGLPDTLPVDLYGIALGDVAIITSPTECFHKHGVRVRENSPFEFTMTLGYTNGYRSYMPTLEAFEYGCYEVDVTRFIAGTGERMADEQIDMLRELKNA